MKRLAVIVLVVVAAACSSGGAKADPFQKRINGVSDCNALESEREQENDLRLDGDAQAGTRVKVIHDRMVKAGC